MRRRRGADYRGPETWGSRFQQRRDQMGLTQADIAGITAVLEPPGLTQQSISRFENDDVHPRLGTLELYARSVGTTVEDLFPQELRPRGRSFAARKAEAHKKTARQKKRGQR